MSIRDTKRTGQAPARVSPELQPTRVATGGEYELARRVEREGETAEAEDRFGSVGARLFDASSRGPRRRGFIIRVWRAVILPERRALYVRPIIVWFTNEWSAN